MFVDVMRAVAFPNMGSKGPRRICKLIELIELIEFSKFRGFSVCLLLDFLILILLLRRDSQRFFFA